MSIQIKTESWQTSQDVCSGQGCYKTHTTTHKKDYVILSGENLKEYHKKLVEFGLVEYYRNRFDKLYFDFEAEQKKEYEEYVQNQNSYNVWRGQQGGLTKLFSREAHIGEFSICSKSKLSKEMGWNDDGEFTINESLLFKELERSVYEAIMENDKEKLWKTTKLGLFEWATENYYFGSNRWEK